ncbi:cerebellar degeneration-related protein 2 isoform X1 [Sagmatias obliquidens]|uniref:Cerebellar degeneration-related protein 2 isoform X1 n=1 Tax=Tursiops truncatus TaxID=9739 RepID=A0A6J3Q0T1_TURTR|nr:cerebellar degeneration-related protein 2 isoform X1 [Lagenorhynchus obliquidens]XP_030727322.1 cerebellar degeneration-related protein 2 isoform X1 [Globicephala melas]XP_033695839.1 cerebellar degeneration-related protein 2 isoform X1 [Tursiops truncatus]
MLAENLVEEFEMKEDEPWYDHQDLQQDLQLAAELGKTLLDRNTELEDSLQQMYTTNQEQFQEIEYLTKQVELLRQMNEQHAKVYEQLDVTARELEETNQKLVADSRASQQKILRHFVYDHVFAEKITALQQSPDEEENEHLKKTVTMLQAQLSLERQKRATVEEEYGLVLKENSELEQQLGAAEAYRTRVLELQADVAEMRQMLQSERPFVNGVEKLVPDSLFVPVKEPSQSLLEEMLLTMPEAHRKPLKRSSSETVLSSLAGGDIVKGHEETCIRRAKAVKQRGISLLHEVDMQYSTLKVKYEELLRKCQQEEDSLAHKAVQTSRAKDPAAVNAQPEPGTLGWEPASVTPEPISCPTTSTPPEYKVLFKEIFSCIKKTKQEIDEQRTKYRSLSSHS